MLIRSQDKEILANMEGPIAIEILGDGKGHATMYWKDSYVLGTYSSKEKTMKVLDMIQEAYCKFMSVKNDDAWGGKESVFYMPADSEVEA